MHLYEKLLSNLFITMCCLQFMPHRSIKVYSKINQVIIHSTHHLFSDWLKAYSEFRNQRLGHHLAADYTIIMSWTLKVTGNHVMYDRGA